MEAKKDSLLVLLMITLIMIGISFQPLPVNSRTDDKGGVSPAFTPAPASAEGNYTTHPPIKIDNDSDFAQTAYEEGWAGDGTEDNPYIIEGYEINSTIYEGPEKHCIYIGNVTSHFIIRDCYLHNTIPDEYPVKYTDDKGIYLKNTRNGKILNNHISSKENVYGVYLQASTNILVKKNNISHSFEYGISISGSDGRNEIVNNTIYKNKGAMEIRKSNWIEVTKNDIIENNNGIKVDETTNCDFTENRIINNTERGYGLYFGGFMDTSNNNTVRDNIIKNNEGWGLVFGGGSAYNTVVDNLISNNYGGIASSRPVVSLLGIPQNNIFKENHIMNNSKSGILLGKSTDDYLVSDNYIYNSGAGIKCVEYSGGHQIYNNRIYKGGILLKNRFKNQLNSYQISSNTVNGKPLYFWKGKDNKTISGDAGQVILVNCSNIDIFNSDLSETAQGVTALYSSAISVTNNSLDRNKHHGIRSYSINNLTINNNSISHNRQSGIELGLRRYHKSCDNVNISNNNISDNGRYGIYVDYSNHVDIHDNKIVSNGHMGLYIATSDNNRIINNLIKKNGFGCRLFDSYYNIFHENRFIHDSMLISPSTFSMDPAAYYTNKVDQTNTVNGKPIYFVKNKTDATVPNDAGEVMVASSSNIRIKDQDFKNSSIAISISYSDEIKISNVSIANMDGAGIVLWNSDYCNIRNSSVINSQMGMDIWMYSQNNEVQNSLFASNSLGIKMYWACSYNTFQNNTISFNTHGFYTEQSDEYHFFGNTFFNNSDHTAYWGAESGSWNKSYPIGGNYWSDYNGTDEKSGPNQNQTGSDGIGDIAYELNGRNVDHYPLMKPSDRTAPVISGVKVERVTENTATISWKTDELSTSTVEYWPNSGGSDENSTYNRSVAKEHEVTITGLKPKTTYRFKVSSFDPSGNEAVDDNGSDHYTFQTPDLTPPEITDLTNGTPTTGDPFNLSANVTDNVEVRNVTLEYWFNGREPNNVEMDEDENFSRTITIPDDAKKLYYRFMANDTSGNLNMSDIFVKNVTDDNPPEISDVTKGTPTTGDSFRLSANITDNIAINSSEVTYWTDVSENKTLTLNGSKQPTYWADISLPSNASKLYFLFQATDTSNNTNVSAPFNTSVMDDDPPFTDSTYTPKNKSFKEGDTITLKGVNTTDNLAVVNYTWIISNGGDQTVLYGEEVNHTFDGAGTYNVSLTVSDPSNNTHTTSFEVKVSKKAEKAEAIYIVGLIGALLLLVLVYAVYRDKRS